MPRASPFRKSSNNNFLVSDRRHEKVETFRRQSPRDKDAAWQYYEEITDLPDDGGDGAGDKMTNMFFDMIGVADTTATKGAKYVDIVKERNIQFAIAKSYKEQVNRSLAEDKLRETSTVSHRDRVRAHRKKARQVATNSQSRCRSELSSK